MDVTSTDEDNDEDDHGYSSLSRSSTYSELDRLAQDPRSNVKANESMLTIRLFAALSGECLLGPIQVSSGTKLRFIVERLDSPPGHEAVIIHGDGSVDAEDCLATLWSNASNSNNDANILDMSIIWRRVLQKGDHVVVHSDIETPKLRSGERGRVCKVLHIHGVDAIKGRDDDYCRHDGDALICFDSIGNAWVDRRDFSKLHVDIETTSEADVQ